VRVCDSSRIAGSTPGARGRSCAEVVGALWYRIGTGIRWREWATCSTSFGLGDLLSQEDLTIVKNPGTDQMEIITKQAGEIRRLSVSPDSATGLGVQIGTVWRLKDGSTVWVPEGSTAPSP
jgi:hypothetical protein